MPTTTDPSAGDVAATADTRTPDAYERQYMRTAGPVLRRDKRVVPKYWHLLFGLPTLAMAAGIPMTLLHVGSKPAPLAMLAFFIPMLLLFALLWVGMSVIRTVVSTREVVVQFGLFGPRIPVQAIRAAAAVHYNWMDYGGWGIKRAGDGTWAYTMPGDGGRGVMIEWTDNKGGARKTLIGCADPDALAASIAQARAAIGREAGEGAATAGGVRVATDAARGEPAGEQADVERAGAQPGALRR